MTGLQFCFVSMELCSSTRHVVHIRNSKCEHNLLLLLRQCSTHTQTDGPVGITVFLGSQLHYNNRKTAKLLCGWNSNWYNMHITSFPRMVESESPQRAFMLSCLQVHSVAFNLFHNLTYFRCGQSCVLRLIESNYAKRGLMGLNFNQSRI